MDGTKPGTQPYTPVMTTPVVIRASLSSALMLGVLISCSWVGQTISEGGGTALFRAPVYAYASTLEGSESKAPVWAACVAPLDDAIRAPVTEFRSSLSFRGLATAAAIRPHAVLAEYSFEHHQKGPELENLTLALSHLDRLMIPSESVLSFNEVTGPREEARGYQEGLMYSGGKVITGTGGGVCVASTALYNAALVAGLPIVERWMHSGPTSYADPTRDAAVVFGAKDLRIKNSTKSPIWIRAAVTDSRVSIKLLSFTTLPYKVVLKEKGLSFIPSGVTTKDIDWLEPELVSKGAPGCNRILTREIWRDGKLLKSEEICHDIRQPIARVVGIRKPAPETAPPDYAKDIPGFDASGSLKIDPGSLGGDHALEVPDALPALKP